MNSKQVNKLSWRECRGKMFELWFDEV